MVNNLQVWVTAYNNDTNIIGWAESFRKTSGGVPFIVVNQGNKPFSPQTTEALFDNGCCHVRNKLNFPCLSKTWNECIRDTITDYVMLSNDDVVFREGWVDAVIPLLRIYDYVGQSYCNISRKAMYSQVGLYDERFTSFGWEDADFYIRMAQANIPIIYGSSYEYPYDGSRVLQYFVHKDGTRCDFSHNNPNYRVFMEKYGREFSEIVQELHSRIKSV